jgi:hypothetical protein
MSHPVGSFRQNLRYLLFVLVIEGNSSDDRRMMVLGCLGQSRPAQEADMVARTVAAVSLAALAVIHVVDLPGTLGPIPLVGIGYLGVIAVAMLGLPRFVRTGPIGGVRVRKEGRKTSGR